MSSPTEHESASESDEAAQPRVGGLVRRGLRFLGGHAYLGVVIAAGLVLTQTVEFSPPPQVRVSGDPGAGLVGDAAPQEFAEDVGNAQAVQIRSTLRLYPEAGMEVSTPDPEVDEHATVLSQPVVTTILGMNATVEQTVRLEGGDLEVDLSIHATPRLVGKAKRGKLPPLSLEQEIVVKSRRKRWMGDPERRVHIDSRSTLVDVEDRGYRLVFSIGDHLFALDLELHRPYA